MLALNSGRKSVLELMQIPFHLPVKRPFEVPSFLTEASGPVAVP